MPGDRFAKIGKGHPSGLKVLVAHDCFDYPDERAGKRFDANETPGQHLEQMPVERRAHFDIETRFFAHFALQGRAMILTRIGPSARQVPLAALVQQQQHTAIVD